MFFDLEESMLRAEGSTELSSLAEQSVNFPALVANGIS